MNEKMTAFTVFLAAMLLSFGAAVAQPGPSLDWGGLHTVLPYNTVGTFATIPYGQDYSETIAIDTTGIAWGNSCHDPLVYQYGTCSYLYKVYAILPEGCSDASCAVQKEWVDIQSLQNPELITVTYSPGSISQFAVVAFIAQANMQYDYASGQWNEIGIDVIQSTLSSDTIVVEGAPSPTVPDIGAWIDGLLLSIQNWICTTFGWWCS